MSNIPNEGPDEKRDAVAENGLVAAPTAGTGDTVVQDPIDDPPVAVGEESDSGTGESTAAEFQTHEGARQAEMAFAVVEGRPITQLPLDLYIPPDALEVILEAFEGPLDLLLYLIKRQNLDILNIRVAEITKQYMDYIEFMKDIQLELAAEYLVMAAVLAEIKSRMLLPRQSKDENEEDDPRAELVRRLQEYERFKQAALDIDDLNRMHRDYWVASADTPLIEKAKLLPDVQLQEMLLALSKVLKRAETYTSHRVELEPLSTRERMSSILDQVQQAGEQFVPFISLFSIEEGRSGVIVTFLAMMELIKEALLEIVQTAPFAPIHVRAGSAGEGATEMSRNE
jgi:segregation and condensation protein A